MNRTKPSNRLADELTRLLADSFPGIDVEAGFSERWQRPCVTFRWAGFADLLPEERFQRLVQVIPEEVRLTDLAGYVWLELAPLETVDAFLSYPRSEDVAGKDSVIYSALARCGFFDRLQARLSGQPMEHCGGDFRAVEAVLEECRVRPALVRDAKLLFILLGAYCDCQVIESILPALQKRFGDGR